MYFYRDRPVAVVGTDNYAMTEALMLLDYTDDVLPLTNGSSLEANNDIRARLDEAGMPVIDDRLDRLTGDEVLKAVVTQDGRELSVDGLFITLGIAGGTDLAEMLGVPVEGDSVVTNPDQSTSVDRVYAAGDAAGGHQQIATSVGERARTVINLLKEPRGADYVDYQKLETKVS